MSSRERWTIYPLLFFSIGLALYNRVAISEQVDTGVVTCDVLQCRRVRVLGANGQEQASLSERGLTAHAVNVTAPGGEGRIVLDTGVTDAGQFQLLGGDGKRRVAFGSDDKKQAGEMAIFGNSPDVPLVVMAADQGAGTVSTQTEAGQRLVFLTHSAGSAGTLAVFGGGETPAVVLVGNKEGGSVETFTDAAKRLVYMTHDSKGSGTLVSFDAEGKPRFYLTASLRQPVNEAGEPAKPDADATQPSDANPATDEPSPDDSAPVVPPDESSTP